MLGVANCPRRLLCSLKPTALTRVQAAAALEPTAAAAAASDPHHRCTVSPHSRHNAARSSACIADAARHRPLSRSPHGSQLLQLTADLSSMLHSSSAAKGSSSSSAAAGGASTSEARRLKQQMMVSIAAAAAAAAADENKADVSTSQTAQPSPPSAVPAPRSQPASPALHASGLPLSASSLPQWSRSSNSSPSSISSPLWSIADVPSLRTGQPVRDNAAVSSSASVSPFLTPQTSARPIAASRSPLTPVSLRLQRQPLLTTASAHSSPVSAATSPCRTPPLLFASARGSAGGVPAITAASASLSASIAASRLLSLSSTRSAVLESSDLIFCIFDCLEFTQLCALTRVCRRWLQRLTGIGRSLPASQSLDLSRLTSQSGFSRHGRRRSSLLGRLLASFACSVPTSPTDRDGRGGHSAGRALDDSALLTGGIRQSIAMNSSTSLRPSRPGPTSYFTRRTSVVLTSLPLTRPARLQLLRRLAHVRHLKLSRRAERRLDGEFVSDLIDSLSASPVKLLSLSLCSCGEAANFTPAAGRLPLLCPSFLFSYAISHTKRKPVGLSDPSFTLLFRPSSIASCFSALSSLSLANCHQLAESSFLLLSSFPCLQSLCLRHCLQLTDDALESIVRQNTRLTAMDLSGCRSLTNASAYYLSSFLSPCLQQLDLSSDALINDAGLLQLAACTELRCLQLRALEFVTDKGLLGLSGCRKLTRLDVSDCPFVSNSCLAHLSLYLSIDSLGLAGCTALSDRGVHYLASSRQHSTAAAADASSAERQQRQRERAERVPGLIPADQLLNVVGLDAEEEVVAEEDDDSWCLRSLPLSRASSPAHSPRSVLPLTGSPARMLLSPAAALHRSGASPLRHLSVSRCANLTDQSVRQLSTYAPLLLSLDLSQCSQLTDGSVLLMAAALTQLTTLNLSGCSRLSNAAMQPLSRLRLVSLHLGGCSLIGDDGIARLCGDRPPLSSSMRCLNLSDLPRLSDAGLQSVATGLLCLSSLSVALCPLLTDLSAFHLSIFLPLLAELQWTSSSALSDEGCSRLLRMQAMTRLDVSHCTRVSSLAISGSRQDKDRQREREREQPSAAAAEPDWSEALELLVLRGCAGITEEAVDKARKQRARLKIVH